MSRVDIQDSSERYHLAIHAGQPGYWRMTVYDCLLGDILCSWLEPKGSSVAKKIVGSGRVKRLFRMLSKTQFKRLLLEATRLELKRNESPKLPSQNCPVLELFRRSPNSHWCEQELSQLLSLAGLQISRPALRAYLDRLLANDHLMRIEVGDRTFYDENTRSHSHVYNPITGKLRDLDEKLLSQRSRVFIESPCVTKQRH